MILDREENPKDVYEALNEAGIETFVSEVEHPSDVPEMLIQLGERLNLEAKANELATSIRKELEGIPQHEGPIVLPMIWHEPPWRSRPRSIQERSWKHVVSVSQNLNQTGMAILLYHQNKSLNTTSKVYFQGTA